MIDFNAPIVVIDEVERKKLFDKLISQLESSEPNIEIELPSRLQHERCVRLYKAHYGRMKNKIPKDRIGVKQ